MSRSPTIIIDADILQSKFTNALSVWKLRTLCLFEVLPSSNEWLPQCHRQMNYFICSIDYCESFLCDKRLIRNNSWFAFWLYKWNLNQCRKEKIKLSSGFGGILRGSTLVNNDIVWKRVTDCPFLIEIRRGGRIMS